MPILWVGGEDIDFLLGDIPATAQTAGWFRAGYARGVVGNTYPAGASYTIIRSSVFPGGEVTSCWISAQTLLASCGTGRRELGLCKSGTNSTGFWVGGGSQSNKYAIYKQDGGVLTRLAEEAGVSHSLALHKFDIQLIDYGANGTINFYVDNVLKVTYTGDIRLTGITGFDSIYATADGGGGITGYWYSEIVVSTDDTRPLLGVVTHYPSGAGDANAWDGTGYAGIDEFGLSDSDQIYTNTTDIAGQFALSNCPAGTFSVIATCIKARAAKSATAAVTKLRLGLKSAGAEDLDAGQSMSVSLATYERIMIAVNGVGLSTAIMDAAQLDLASLT
jgi:hypothetical protein